MPATVFSLYIVRCADNSLYTGIAADVGKRMADKGISFKLTDRAHEFLAEKGFESWQKRSWIDIPELG